MIYKCGELIFVSPQLSHVAIPGTCNLKCVRRFFVTVLDVLLFGTAIWGTSLNELPIRLSYQKSLPIQQASDPLLFLVLLEPSIVFLVSRI